MKKKISFILLINILLPLLCNGTHAQTGRYLEKASNNFSWYCTYRNGKQGAETTTGKTIIPLSRGYNYVRFKVHNEHIGYFEVEKNGKYGICDIHGKEIIATKFSNIILTNDGFNYADTDGKWKPLGYTLVANGNIVKKSSILSETELYLSYFNKADKYFEQKKWKKAGKNYKEAAKYERTYAVYFNIAATYYNRGKYRKAYDNWHECSFYAKGEERDEVLQMMDKCTKKLNLQAQRNQAIAASIIGAAAGIAVGATMGPAMVPSNPYVTSPQNINQTQAMLMQQTLQQTNYQMMLQQQWQRNMEAAAKQSFDQYMEQARIQFQNEYEEFRKWNRKPDGSEYSIVEYMEMRNRAWQQSQQDNYNPNTDDNGGYNPVQMHTRTKWCMVCGHSGNCPTCNGKGHYLVLGNDTLCPSCKNHNGKCTACGGTGERTVKEAY